MDAPTLIEVPETSTDEWPLWAVRARAEREAEEASKAILTAASQVVGDCYPNSFLMETLEFLGYVEYSKPIWGFRYASRRLRCLRRWCDSFRYPKAYISLLDQTARACDSAADAWLLVKKHEVVAYFHLVPRGSAGLVHADQPSWN